LISGDWPRSLPRATARGALPQIKVARENPATQATDL
jgi:hypothetical protein